MTDSISTAGSVLDMTILEPSPQTDWTHICGDKAQESAFPSNPVDSHEQESLEMTELIAAANVRGSFVFWNENPNFFTITI